MRISHVVSNHTVTVKHQKNPEWGSNSSVSHGSTYLRKVTAEVIKVTM